MITRNLDNFRVYSPDETNSNRWNAVFEVTNRCSTAEILPVDDHVAPDGRVMEMLSEHQCQGWLEGYLLSGRHGFFPCYEAFIHIIDSMFNEHAEWLKVSNAGDSQLAMESEHSGAERARAVTRTAAQAVVSDPAPVVTLSPQLITGVLDLQRRERGTAAT